MVESLKKKKIYIFATILTFISVGVSFLSYGISVWASDGKFPYYIVLLSFVFLYALLSYVSGDILIVKYRRKVQEFNPVLPESEQRKVWDARTPFILALIATFLVVAILYIIYLASGRWPLL